MGSVNNYDLLPDSSIDKSCISIISSAFIEWTTWSINDIISQEDKKHIEQVLKNNPEVFKAFKNKKDLEEFVSICRLSDVGLRSKSIYFFDTYKFDLGVKFLNNLLDKWFSFDGVFKEYFFDTLTLLSVNNWDQLDLYTSKLLAFSKVLEKFSIIKPNYYSDQIFDLWMNFPSIFDNRLIKLGDKFIKNNLGIDKYYNFLNFLSESEVLWVQNVKDIWNFISSIKKDDLKKINVLFSDENSLLYLKVAKAILANKWIKLDLRNIFEKGYIIKTQSNIEDINYQKAVENMYKDLFLSLTGEDKKLFFQLSLEDIDYLSKNLDDPSKIKKYILNDLVWRYSKDLIRSLYKIFDKIDKSFLEGKSFCKATENWNESRNFISNNLNLKELNKLKNFSSNNTKIAINPELQRQMEKMLDTQIENKLSEKADNLSLFYLGIVNENGEDLITATAERFFLRNLGDKEISKNLAKELRDWLGDIADKASKEGLVNAVKDWLIDKMRTYTDDKDLLKKIASEKFIKNFINKVFISFVDNKEKEDLYKEAKSKVSPGLLKIIQKEEKNIPEIQQMVQANLLWYVIVKVANDKKESITKEFILNNKDIIKLEYRKIINWLKSTGNVNLLGDSNKFDFIDRVIELYSKSLTNDKVNLSKKTLEQLKKIEKLKKETEKIKELWYEWYVHYWEEKQAKEKLEKVTNNSNAAKKTLVSGEEIKDYPKGESNFPQVKFSSKDWLEIAKVAVPTQEWKNKYYKVEALNKLDLVKEILNTYFEEQWFYLKFDSFNPDDFAKLWINVDRFDFRQIEKFFQLYVFNLAKEREVSKEDLKKYNLEKTIFDKNNLHLIVKLLKDKVSSDTIYFNWIACPEKKNFKLDLYNDIVQKTIQQVPFYLDIQHKNRGLSLFEYITSFLGFWQKNKNS